MKNKKKLGLEDLLVYSTNQAYYESQQNEAEETQTVAPSQQNLRIVIERKHRGGKTVTLVEGFEGKEADLEALGKKLKTFCGCGGSVKEGVIIIQGEKRQRIAEILQKDGYRYKFSGG
ncbi:MAG: translation initiation factor [Chitinophagales bacterium]|nr:translation initiation factor [Bacteroidota bacterium]MCB9042547.1 translation initiation factor [Chitinophagales bacterium]